MNFDQVHIDKDFLNFRAVSFERLRFLTLGDFDWGLKCVCSKDGVKSVFSHSNLLLD